MAGTIAWQDFEAANRVAQERAAVLAGQALAQLHAAVVAATGTKLAATPKLSATTCAERVPDPNGLPEVAIPLLVLDSAGQVQCRFGAPPEMPVGRLPWFDTVHAGAPFAIGIVAAEGRRTTRPVVAVPIGDQNVAVLVLTPHWLEAAVKPDIADPSAAVWLLDSRRKVVATGGATAPAQYTDATLAALLRDNTVAVRGFSAAGSRFSYATSLLPGGWRIIVALSSEAEHVKAVRVLVLRTAELGALLIIGLAAVVVAADVAFGSPLRRLSSAVRQWQAGEMFDPGDFTGAPDEVQQLALSFASATAVLREKQDELVRVQKQQTLLVLEVHHRVKNNLQVIASLLNLQASRIRLPEARAEFQAARDRVRALATLHRHLYADGGMHTINMRSFLTELCGQLFQAMGETEDHRIQLQIDAPELRMSSDEAVPLALIVTEAVSNSVKYAFPAGRSGRICVSLMDIGGTLELVISDDGVGIAAIHPEGDTNSRDGIGLRLIRGFSRQLGASLTVQHDHGTRYVVTLPVGTSSIGRAVEPLDATAAAGENAL